LHYDEAVGVEQAERPEMNGVRQAEHRGVGRDAQAERQDGDGDESRGTT
jgi:hypothetical protein